MIPMLGVYIDMLEFSNSRGLRARGVRDEEGTHVHSDGVAGHSKTTSNIHAYHRCFPPADYISLISPMSPTYSSKCAPSTSAGNRLSNPLFSPTIPKLTLQPQATRDICHNLHVHTMGVELRGSDAGIEEEI